MTDEEARREIRARVRGQYERHPYPAPRESLDDLIRAGEFPLGTPSHFFHWYWPRLPVRGGLDILIAGSGAELAAIYGLLNPEARITAIDISRTSLDHCARLLARHDIKNVTQDRLAIEDVASLGCAFDLVVSPGAIQHLPAPRAGLEALARVLRSEGSMFLEIYGRYGRDGIALVRALAAKLGFEAESATSEDLELLGRLIKDLPPTHPMTWRRLRKAGDLGRPGGLSDMILHPHETAFTLPELFALLDAAGLAVQRFAQRAHYAPETTGLDRSPLWGRIAPLPERERLAVGELYRAAADTHLIVACRKDRPPETYDVAPEGAGWDSFVPVPNPGLVVAGDPSAADALVLSWRFHDLEDLALTLEGREAALFRLADGERTIGAIARAAGSAAAEVGKLFSRLFDFDFVHFRR